MKNAAIVALFILSGIIAENTHAIELDYKWGKLDIHGFMSQGFIKSDRNNFYAKSEDGSFQFNELGINFSTDLSDYVRAGIQLISRDLGSIGNNEIVVDWAFVDYRWKDWMGFRCGKLKIPVGFYNYTRDADMVRTSIFLPDSVYHESQRDLFNALYGLAIYGYLDLDFFGGVNYHVYYGEVNPDDDKGMAKYIEDSGVIDLLNFDTAPSCSASLEWNTPLEGLRLGGSITKLDIKTNSRAMDHVFWKQQNVEPGTNVLFKLDDFKVSTLSVEYTYEDLILAAEYSSIKSDRLIDRTFDKLNMEGYYVSASYRFTDLFECGAYYSVFYNDKNDKDGEVYKAIGEPGHRGWQKELVLSTRFDINENWIFKIESHFINGTALMFDQDNPKGLDKESFLLALKATFNF
ncbi:Porin domain-containing protein [Candidatus Magnetomoraceae bacterium gMMP-15]